MLTIYLKVTPGSLRDQCRESKLHLWGNECSPVQRKGECNPHPAKRNRFSKSNQKGLKPNKYGLPILTNVRVAGMHRPSFSAPNCRIRPSARATHAVTGVALQPFQPVGCATPGSNRPSRFNHFSRWVVPPQVATARRGGCVYDLMIDLVILYPHPMESKHSWFELGASFRKQVIMWSLK